MGNVVFITCLHSMGKEIKLSPQAGSSLYAQINLKCGFNQVRSSDHQGFGHGRKLWFPVAHSSVHARRVACLSKNLRQL